MLKYLFAALVTLGERPSRFPPHRQPAKDTTTTVSPNDAEETVDVHESPIIWHLWSNSTTNLSQQTACRMDSDLFAFLDVAPPAPPFFASTTELPHNTTTKFIVLPTTYDGFPPKPPHPNPVVQMGIFVSGQGLWRSTSGEEVAYGPGSLIFQDDLLSNGHYSRTSSVNEPCNMIFLQFPEYKSQVDNPCNFLGMKLDIVDGNYQVDLVTESKPTLQTEQKTLKAPMRR